MKNVKTVVIFIPLLISAILVGFTVNIEGFPYLNPVFKLIGFLIQGIYIVTLVGELEELRTRNTDLETTFFYINTFVWLGYFGLVMLLSDDGNFRVDGILALFGLYAFYAYVHSLVLFPAKLLKSIEINKEARFKDYYKVFLMFLFLPVGIWFIHPKFLRLVKPQEEN